MKKILSLLLAATVLFCCFGITAFADEATATIYVSIADKGNLKVAYEAVTVTDIDNDGALTVNDALYAAHEETYSGGAAAGYSFYTHKDYGLCIGKLWGDTSGNFGYYLNNASCWSLSDTVKDGDSLYAFVYKDGKFFSDKYSFFDKNTVSGEDGEEVTLTLTCAGYDPVTWAPVTLPVAGAMITVDGEETGITTDANGCATITLEAGEHVISATSASETLVPPVCIADIEGGFDILSIIRSIIEKIVDAVKLIINLFVK